MIDVNNHLLGNGSLPFDLNRAVTICEQASRDGVEEVVVIQRMGKSVKTDAENAAAFEGRARQLQARLSDNPEINLKLSFGYEWLLSDNLPLRLRGFDRHPTINESHYLLIGFPSLPAKVDCERIIGKVISDGHVPIIARPECSRMIRRGYTTIGKLVGLGCLIQSDALSMIGGYTEEIESFTKEMLERGQVHFIASGAGRHDRFEACLSAAFEQAGRVIGRSAAAYLVKDNPSAVLSNTTMIKTRGQGRKFTALETAFNSRA